jgi:hypothetical protein
MSENTKEAVKVVIFLALGFALLIGLCFGSGTLYRKVSCTQYAQMNPAYQFQYNYLIGDCFVKYGDLWISTSLIRIVDGQISVLDK